MSLDKIIKKRLYRNHLYEVNTVTSDAYPFDVITRTNLEAAGLEYITRLRAVVTGGDAWIYPSAGVGGVVGDPGIGDTQIIVTNPWLFTVGRAIMIYETAVGTEWFVITEKEINSLTLDGALEADYSTAAEVVDVPNIYARMNVTTDAPILDLDNLNWQGVVMQRQGVDTTIKGWVVAVE